MFEGLQIGFSIILWLLAFNLWYNRSGRHKWPFKRGYTMTEQLRHYKEVARFNAVQAEKYRLKNLELREDADILWRVILENGFSKREEVSQVL